MKNIYEEEPLIIKGGIYEDERGKLCHFNDLDLAPIKRVYILEHSTIQTVRAWQAHQKERKWFKVLAGAFKVVLVEIDNWSDPSIYLPFSEFALYADEVSFLRVPGGYATGLQALEPHSKLMVFSDTDLKDSALDDFRFDKALWYKW